MTNATPHAEFAGALGDANRAPPDDIASSNATERRRRFSVHRNTHVATLVDALRGSFPVTVQLLGDAFFDAMAQARVQADPPRTPVLTAWAESFPAFAAEFEPLDAAPYARDVVALEAARISAYHAADASPITRDALQAWMADPTRLAHARARVHPAARVLRCGHPAASLWLAHQDPDTLDDVLSELDVDTAEDVLVTRRVFDVQVEVLPAGGHALFDALATGASVTEAMLAAAHAGGDPVDLFRRLLDAGAINQLVSASDPTP